MIEALEILTDLTKNEVKYLLCGGLAVNIYGIPRVTADIDLIIDFTKDNVANFIEILLKHHYISNIPVGLENFVDESYKNKIKIEKNLIAYSFHSTLRSVTILDVIIDCPYSFSEMWINRESRNTRLGTINLVSIEHLIGMKEIANRIQDKKDVEALLKIKK